MTYTVAPGPAGSHYFWGLSNSDPGIDGSPDFDVADGNQTFGYLHSIATYTAAGSSTPSLTLRNVVLPPNTGTWYVSVAINGGSNFRGAAKLTILPPTITTQLISQTISQHGSATFAVGSPGSNYCYWQVSTGGSQLGSASNSFNLIDGPVGSDNSDHRNSYFTASGSATQSLNLSNSNEAGIYNVLVTLQTAGGSATSNATLSIPLAPVITTQPADQTAIASAAATFWVAAAGSPAPTYQWKLNGSPISGATAASYSLSATAENASGTYSVTVTNSEGSVTSNPVTLTVEAVSTRPPEGNQQGTTSAVSSGSTWTASANPNVGASAASILSLTRTRIASGGPGHSGVPNASGGDTFQWFFNGVPIPGASDSTYVLTDASVFNNGDYTCLVANPAGSVTTAPATLSVIETFNPGRIINFSARAGVGAGFNQLIAGFVVGGAGTTGVEPVLIRASGPALTQFGLTSALSDPLLTLNGPGGILASNSGWNGNQQIASAASSEGAFAWTSASSHDSALVESLTEGPYTAQIVGASGDTGVALAEIYDATASGGYTPASPRLINLSARAQVGAGSDCLIAGFVISGMTSKTVLIRASGPALSAFGLSGVLGDPQLQLFQSNSNGTSTLLEQNTGWGADPQIAATAVSVGAFSWGSLATADSAILVTLPPGAYTAQVSGAAGDTGLALVEVYDVQ